MTTYTTADGREWPLDEEYTANGFHYRWDGAEFGEGGPWMAAVGRPVFIRLEVLAALDRVSDADLAEGAVPDHPGDPQTCARCRELRGEPVEATAPVEPLALPAAAEGTVEMGLPLGGAA
ncbi:hypothetical protein ACWGCW_00455 [Streptomyces sp. NPDC054933]